MAEVVCRVAVSLHHYLVTELAVVDRDLAVDLVEVACSAGVRHSLADNIGLALSQIFLDLLLGEAAAVSVIASDALVVLQRLQTLRSTEAVVSVAAVHQLLSIFTVDLKALALDIGAVLAAYNRAFIVVDASHFESFEDNISSTLHQAHLIGVLDTQDELALLRLSQKVGIKRRSQVTDVHEAGR